MSTPVQRVVAALSDFGLQPRRSGEGWVSKCPAHDDASPSLSIAEGDHHRALVHCHAGCCIEAVVGSLGMRVADLFEGAPVIGPIYPGRPRTTPSASTQPRAHAAPRHSVDVDTRKSAVYATVADAVRVLGHRRGDPAGAWSYQDAEGRVVGHVLRWNLPTGKTFLPLRHAEGGWTVGAMPSPRPLYRLVELRRAPLGQTVYVCEGEKAADAASALGLLATSSAGGARAAHHTDWSPLAGRPVVIVPDHDEAGERYANDVMRAAVSVGAASVRVARLTGIWAELPMGGDIADCLETGRWSREALRLEVETLAARSDQPNAAQPCSERHTVLPFPVGILPPVVCRFVACAARTIGCDPSQVAAPLLTAMAAAIGNTHRIELKAGWTEPPVLWMAIVGESGTHKTPAFKAALGPLKAAEAREQKAYAARCAAWEEEQSLNPKNGSRRPVAKRHVVGDTTVEALAPILSANPRGILVGRDELAGWMTSFDRYAKSGRTSADSPQWLSMHSGEALSVDRKTGPMPTIFVPSACVWIVGGIQPGILAKVMVQEHKDSGLLARMLFVMPPRRPRRWSDAEMDPAVEATLRALFGRLLALTAATDENGDPRPHILRLTQDARAAWATFYNSHAREQEQLADDEAAAWSKLEGYAARFALIIHLLRRETNDPALEGSDIVDRNSVDAGVALAAWFGSETRRVYATLSETSAQKSTRRLLELIERHGGSTSARELVQRCRAYKDVAQAELALRALADQGHGTWAAAKRSGPGGPPAPRFTLHPSGKDAQPDSRPAADRPGLETGPTRTDGNVAA
jgi:hypothetical protein